MNLHCNHIVALHQRRSGDTQKFRAVSTYLVGSRGEGRRGDNLWSWRHSKASDFLPVQIDYRAIINHVGRNQANTAREVSEIKGGPKVIVGDLRRTSSIDKASQDRSDRPRS